MGPRERSSKPACQGRAFPNSALQTTGSEMPKGRKFIEERYKVSRPQGPKYILLQTHARLLSKAAFLAVGLAAIALDNVEGNLISRSLINLIIHRASDMES